MKSYISTDLFVIFEVFDNIGEHMIGNVYVKFGEPTTKSGAAASKKRE